MSFIGPIRWQCRTSRTSPALSVPGSPETIVTYERLGHYLDNVSAHVLGLGVRPGAVYGLLIRNTFLHIAIMLALEEMGAATVSLTSENVAAEWDLAAVLTDHDAANLPCRTIRTNANWLFSAGSGHSAPEPFKPAPDDLRRVVLTSGSTGTPKAVPRTHGDILHLLSQSEFIFGGVFPHCARMLCWLGLNTGLGYRTLIDTLSRGGMFCAPDASMARSVGKIWLYQIQAMLGSPQSIAEFTAYSRQRRCSYPSLEVVLTTGSQLPSPLAERFRTEIHNRLVNVYGLTEAGIIATAPSEALDLDNGEAGFVLPGVRVEIVDPDTGSPVRHRGGRLHVSSYVCIRGYRGEKARNAAFEEGGFFSGDNGFVSPNGLLTIYGRDSNVINLGGVKTTLEQVERNISKAPGVREAAVGLLENSLGIKQLVAVIVPEEHWTEHAFWAYCERYLVRDEWPARIKISNAVPRIANGKINRQLVTALVQN